MCVYVCVCVCVCVYAIFDHLRCRPEAAGRLLRASILEPTHTHTYYIYYIYIYLYLYLYLDR